MPEFRLSVRAAEQLTDIYAFTDARFGRYQADAYHAGFERTFGLLADFPRMGAEADHLVPGYRRFRFQSHHIFYTEEAYGVLVRSVIHAAQDLRPSLIR